MRQKSFIFCLICLLSFSHCLIVVKSPPFEGGRWVPGGTFEKSLAMSRGEELSLENARGNIDVEGWDEERLEVRAEAREGAFPTRRLRFYSWKQAELNIEVGRLDGRIEIRAAEEIRRNIDRAVHYVLHVPRSVHLRNVRNGVGNIRVRDIYGSIVIEAEEGDVKIENFSGSLDIELGQGNIEAEILDIRPEDEIRITAENGHIHLTLEPQAQVELETVAPEGSVTSDFDLSSEPEPGTRAHVFLHARHGDIRVRKGNGDKT